MRNLTLIAQTLVRITGLIQIVLGVMFWFGIATFLIPVHIISGLIFVISIWTLSVLSIQSRTYPGLAVFTILYGILIIALGLFPARLLLGPAHWIIQVVHLAVGIAGMGLAQRLSTGIMMKSFAPRGAPGHLMEDSHA